MVLAWWRLWPQWAGSIAAYLTMFVIGLMMGWSSPFIARLQAPDSPLPITAGDASWLASLINLGRFPGTILSAVCIDYFGSRKTLLITNIPSALAWICFIIADSVAWLFAARILAGMALGLFLTSFPLYLGEISSPSIRGAIVGFAMGGMPLGSLVGNAMGAYLSIMEFAIIALVPNIINIILFLCLPDSPHHLMKIGKIAETEKSIVWYDRSADVKEEIAKLDEFVNAMPPLSVLKRLKEITLPENRGPIIIIFFLYVIMQLSGLVSIAFYLEVILTNAGVTAIAPSTLVIVVAAIGIVAGWIAIYVVDVFGRKFLLITSCLGVSVSMAMLGTDYILIGMNYAATELQWLPITAVIIFQLFACIGLAPVPSTILSELFPTHTKSIAALIASLTGSIFGFLSASTYQPLVSSITESYTFYLYAIIMGLGAVYTFIFVPETKGKSLQEIQDMLKKNRQKNDSAVKHG